MTEFVRLSETDVGLLAARIERHGGSFRGLIDGLREAGADDAIERARALRALERRLDIDLGDLCARVLRLDAPEVHPLERRVINALAAWEPLPGGGRELWVFPERVRELRDLIDEGLASRNP